VDPPPILELRLPVGSNVEDAADVSLSYLVLALLDVAGHDEPHADAAALPMLATMESTPAEEHSTDRNSRAATDTTQLVVGTWASAAHMLRDSEQYTTRRPFFVFPDLGVKRPGVFRIRFILYHRTRQNTLHRLTTTVSDPFVVYSTKMFPGVLGKQVWYGSAGQTLLTQR
jgi:hypothetical protein